MFTGTVLPSFKLLQSILKVLILEIKILSNRRLLAVKNLEDRVLLIF